MAQIGTDAWDAIARRSTEDLLVDLALGRFRRRPPMSALPIGLPRDIRAFFGSDANGCRRADELLFRAGDAGAVDDACRRSAVGKLLPNALYIHRTALEALDPLLRAYGGCARAYLGEISPSGSARSRSLRGAGSARARSLRGAGRQETGRPRIPIPESRSPIRLTRQEERAGLLDGTASIGTRSGWAQRLRQ